MSKILDLLQLIYDLDADKNKLLEGNRMLTEALTKERTRSKDLEGQLAKAKLKAVQDEPSV